MSQLKLKYDKKIEIWDIKLSQICEELFISDGE